MTISQRKRLASLVAAVMAGFSGLASGADVVLKADLQMITHDAESGVCAIWVVPRGDSPGTLADLSGCNTRWVNLDCTADFVASKGAASINYQQAQAAIVTNRPMNVVVTDDFKLAVGSTQYCTGLTTQLFVGN